MAAPRSVLIVGGTAGLGFHTTLQIAKEHPGFLVVIAARSSNNDAAGRINKTLGQTNVKYMPLDLADLDNVRDFARKWVTEKLPPIKALLLNAGGQYTGPLEKAPSGIEKTFAINHVGNAFVFFLLFPQLADNARVVLTSSGTHDPDQETGGFPKPIFTTAQDAAYVPPAAAAAGSSLRYYSTAKLCNVLFMYALHRRLQERKSSVAVTVMDPGLMPGTELARTRPKVVQWLWKHVMPHMLPVLRLLTGSSNIHRISHSGANLARLAFGPEFDGVSGKYFEGNTEIRSSKDSYDVAKQEDLWGWTVKFLTAGDAAQEAQWRELRVLPGGVGGFV
ncbi:dehydrogenase/reductase [Lasiosphaeria miniovina]|uniref:Dehydrogenase/reductase n=1 Tax=Lasiosphaeria miniovina TaxID=1954250 RepID=A0AA40AB71_9PEZI|nr:dehydrogenase/reductase [Lasiosphaeria miniovina]KAK0712423.1 dehydrogenase/reductase [Lasiosphaeria miniovina]